MVGEGGGGRRGGMGVRAPDPAGKAEGRNAEPRICLRICLGTSWCREPVCHHREAHLRGWSRGITGDLGKTGPEPLTANKSVTDSKIKFLLVIYP